MSRFKLECLHADTCLSDYWLGHHLAHVCVPVWHNMTISDLRRALCDELQQGAVAGNDDIARLLSGNSVEPEDEKRADMVTRAAYAAIARDVKMKKPGARYPFAEIEPVDDEDGPSIFAYFVFREF